MGTPRPSKRGEAPQGRSADLGGMRATTSLELVASRSHLLLSPFTCAMKITSMNIKRLISFACLSLAVHAQSNDAIRALKILPAPKEVRIAEGIKVMFENMDYWRDAPVWTVSSIADATADWFKYLGSSSKEARRRSSANER